jgi:hypothetical protein
LFGFGDADGAPDDGAGLVPYGRAEDDEGNGLGDLTVFEKLQEWAVRVGSGASSLVLLGRERRHERTELRVAAGAGFAVLRG